jgi:hypothetical protein
MRILVPFSLLLLLIACTSIDMVANSTQTKVITQFTPSKNFKFYIEYGSCLVDSYDSGSGIFNKDMGPDEEHLKVMAFLSRDQLIQIYNEMHSIKVFNYPEIYFIPTLSDGIMVYKSSMDHYLLNIIDGTNSGTIKWDNNIVEPMDQDAKQLLNLILMIRDYIIALPGVNALPAPSIGCI